MRCASASRSSTFFFTGNRISTLLTLLLTSNCVPIHTTLDPKDPFSYANFNPKVLHHNKTPIANFRLCDVVPFNGMGSSTKRALCLGATTLGCYA